MPQRKKYRIRILPQDRQIIVPEEYNLRQAILDAGLDVDSSCGGVGTCGRCKVIINDGRVRSKKSISVKDNKKKQRYVLACMTKVIGDITVTIPEKKKRSAKIDQGTYDILAGKTYSGINKDELSEPEIKPWIIKENIKVENPTLDYNTNDIFRFKKSIKNELLIENINIPLRVVKKCPNILRKNNWEVCITIDKNTNTVLNIQPPEKKKDVFGFAIDIGTTSLVVYLVDISNGNIKCSAAEYNPQIKFGEDIINRIVYSLKKGGLNRLQEVVMDSINEMMLRLIDKADIDEEDVVSVMVAGNSTMMHIFYGVPPKSIREEPYITVASKFPEVSAGELGLKYVENAIVYNIEGVASYLGGDITSGVIATNMAKKNTLTLFIDLGTNGEIVAGNNDWLMGCSCSAGPAFEGGGVKCGIRAVDGAIEKVMIEQDTYKCFYEVIGGVKPSGICGSGLIDLIGELYLKGVIDRKGRFNKDIGNAYLKCLEKDCLYIIASKENSATGEDIYISEADINNLLRAKAAVYSGIKTLLEEIDLKINDIEKVYIAGGLGKNINIQNAIIIGMLPDIAREKYFFLGNTSVTGAYLSILSMEKYRESSEIANKITYLELSMNMGFMDRYVAGLFLPYTDLKDFPTVEKLFYSK